MLRIPPIDLTFDGHVHTRLCKHAVGEMEEYVQSALQRGLKGLCFLEHMETGIAYHREAWLSDADFIRYHEEGARLRREYGTRITIELGVELGYNRECPGQILARLGQFDWDRIGISCHFLRPDPQASHINLLSRDQANIDRAVACGPTGLLTSYFDQLIEAVKTLPGTQLSHLDAALRHVPGLTLQPAHHAQIEELLRQVKAKGMALEVNTSGQRLRGTPYPAPVFLARALELGIPLTAGSDAHRPEDVGYGFAQLTGYISAALRA